MLLQLQIGSVPKRHGCFRKGCINMKSLFVFVSQITHLLAAH
jgi:hypothetical protein